MNLNQYIKNHVQNILNERLIQNAQSNIDNNIDNAAKKISTVIRYSTIVENIMSMHITNKLLRRLVCEAFKYFKTLPDAFEPVSGTTEYIDDNGYHQEQDIAFQESFEDKIKGLIEETGPDDPDIRKLLTNYAYCCKWAGVDPFDEEKYYVINKVFLRKAVDITVTYDLDYNYKTGVLKPDEFDITKYKCNSKTVIEVDEKKPIIINNDNIFKKFFNKRYFKRSITDEEQFNMLMKWRAWNAALNAGEPCINAYDELFNV